MKAQFIRIYLIAFLVALALFIVLSACKVTTWWTLLIAPLIATTIAFIVAIIEWRKHPHDNYCSGDGIAHMEIEADMPFEKTFEVN